MAQSGEKKTKVKLSEHRSKTANTHVELKTEYVKIPTEAVLIVFFTDK